MRKVPNKEVDLGEPTSFLDHVYLGCTQRQCEISRDIVDNSRTMFESRISAGATEKLLGWEKSHANTIAWSSDMEGRAKKCVERNCELANKKIAGETSRKNCREVTRYGRTCEKWVERYGELANKKTEQLYKVSTPCLDDHHFKKEELESVGQLSKVCSQIVFECLYLARIYRPDILWSVNKLARRVTKMDKSLWQALRKITMLGKSAYFFVVLWNGRTCQEMCGTILWVGEQDDSTTLQSSNSMHWRPSFQRRRIEICGRIVKKYALKLFWNACTWHVLEDLIFYGQWTNLPVQSQKWDQSLGQTPESIDFIYSSYMWIQTVLSCGKHCQTMQTGTVSGLRFCRRSWRLKIHFWRNIVRFRKPYLCSNKLDVQETNCCFSQLNRIWNYLTGHWTETGWFACSGIMGSHCFCSWEYFSCFRSNGATR